MYNITNAKRFSQSLLFCTTVEATPIRQKTFKVRRKFNHTLSCRTVHGYFKLILFR